MDKEKILNLANKGLELVEDMDRKSIYKNLLGNLFFEIRKEAINYTHCCESDSEQFSFDDMRDAFDYASVSSQRRDGMTFKEWMSKR